MSVTKAYHYFFYKLYNFWESVSTPKFWSDWKASVSILVLEIWLLASFIFYYDVKTSKITEIDFTNPIIYIPLLIIFIGNYVIFLSNDNWKKHMLEFNNYTKKQNIIGGIVVWSIVFAIIVNLIFSGYLFYKY